MKSLTEIRNELLQIRYYHIRKKAIDYSLGFTGQIEMMKVVDLYNQTIKLTKSFKLYDIYTSLYIHNQTQASLAEKFGCSTENIQKFHKKLLLFFQKNINDKENI